MFILLHELERWGSAVSCIGRKPITENQYGSLDEGGAINALRKKRMIDSAQLKPGDPEEASTLIERAIGYTQLFNYPDNIYALTFVHNLASIFEN
jgi:hypothetical protein